MAATDAVREPLLPSLSREVRPLAASEAEPAQASTFGATVFNLCNTIVGAGIMSLPAVCKVLGLTLGMVAMVLVTICIDVTAGMLLRATDKVGGATYGGVMEALCGRVWRVALEASVVLNNVGLQVVYLIILGDVLVGKGDEPGVVLLAARHFAGNDSAAARACASREIVVGVASVLFLLPLSCLRSIDSLKFSSIVSIGLIACFVAVTVFMSVAALAGGRGGKGVRYLAPQTSGSEGAFGEVVQLMTVFSVMLNAYVCHYNLNAYRSALPVALRPQMRSAVRLALVICCGVYMTVACFAYLLFGEDVKDDALENFSGDALRGIVRGAPALVFAVKAGYGGSLMGTFPLIGWEPRNTIASLMWRGKQASQLPAVCFYPLTICLIGVIYIISMCVPNVWIAFSFTGATVAVVVGFFAPAAAARGAEPSKWLMPALMALIGALVGAVGVGDSVYGIVSGNTGPP